MYKHFFKVLIFLVSISLYSQSDYIVNNATLWLKNDTISNNCLDYNYNCSLSQLNSDYKLYSNQFSFFIAFKTNNSISKDIVSLKYGNKLIKVTNKCVLKQNDTITTLDSNKSAKIVSYLHNDASFSKKGKLFIDLLNNQSSEDDILEIIFIPKVVSLFMKEKVETYLSLKYGISLEENQYYRSVSNDTLWNPSTLTDFSKDVSGMGNDSDNFYNKNKSYNYNLKGLEIYTDTTFNAKNYVLWGHNGKSKLIVNQNELTINNYKIWHFKKHLDSIDNRLFKIKINQELWNSAIDTLLLNEKIYLYVSHYNSQGAIELTNGQYYEGIFNESNDIIFENINFLNDSRFIFIKAPEMNLLLRKSINCDENTTLNLDFIEGSYPLNLTISNNLFSKKYNAENSKLVIGDLPVGKYNITVKDRLGNEKNSEVEIKKEKKFQVKLIENWELNENGFVIIAPEVLDSERNIEFKWYNDNEILGFEKTIKVDEEGSYYLIVTNGICEDKFEFKVNSNSANLVSLFPNPSKISEEITLQLTNDFNKSVEIKINDINGKLIKLMKRDNLNENSFKFKIETAGVYFVHLKSENSAKVFKVIVN
jgi:hypothetical protein